MANDRTIEIRITAKNMSADELAKARQAIAGFKKDTEGASGATMSLGGALRAAGPLASAFGLSLSVGAAVSFGKALLADADALVKLADKTGMSTEAVQRLKYVAEQSGNTLEQMTSGVSMLQKRLGEGDDSAIGAIKGLGIAVDQFMRMTPDQQFRAIALEVGKIEDPIQRTRVATELFGRAGAELLPSLISNFDDIAASAGVMSDRTVQSLDRVGDKLDEVAAKVKSTASEVAVVVIDVFGELPAFISGVMQGGIAQGMVQANTQALGRDLAARAVKGIKDGFGVLADDVSTSAFDMFSDRNVASMKKTSAAAAAEAKRMAEAHARAAEEATRAWLEAWDEVTRGGREAVSDMQASFKQLDDGTLVQTLDIGQAPKQFEFLKWQIEGVRDAMPPFVGLLPAATGNLTTMGTAAETSGGKIGRMFDTVAPGIKGTLGTLQTAISGTFAQMMLGAKGFHDGFVDIWSSIKGSLLRIFAEIADSFVSGLLKRMLSALSGNKQAFSGGFASLFSGMGTGGQGGAMPSVGSFFGGGAGLPGASGSMIGPEYGTGAMLQTGAGGGTNWGAMAGGGAMAAGGAVGWYQSLQSGSKVGATLSGATTGAGIGTMIAPGIGTAIGAGVGAVAGFASSFFGGKKEEKQVNDLRDAYISAAGGLAQLGEQARLSGMTLDALLKAKTVKDYEAAIGSLNGKLAATAAMQGQLAGLQQQLASRQVMDLQAAEEITAKYGGTLGNLGQQFEAAKVQASFKTVLDDYERLIDMGGDVGGSLFMMKEEIGALAGESKRIGTEIPAQFEPLIKELIRTHQLFSDTGEEITDISTLKFGPPLKSEADTIKDAILELVKALKEQLLPTIDRIPKTINVHTGYTYDPYEPPDGGSGDGGESGGSGGSGGDHSSTPGYATGALITQEHIARVGEGGVPELIGPVGFMAEALAGALAALGAGSGSSRIVVENHLHVIARNGREMAELVAPELPDALSRYGIKVR